MEYRGLIDGLPYGVLLMTEVFEDCNEEACRLWACEREHILGHSLLDFSPPVQPDGRDSSEAVQRFSEAAFSGVAQSFPWKCRRKDSVLIDVEISMKTIEVDSRKVVLASVRDIIKRKGAEKALRESVERYDALANISPIGIFHTNAEGRFLYVNDRWCAITGFSQKEALKKGLALGLHPEDRKRVLDEWCAAAGEGGLFKTEYRIQHTDGTITWVVGQMAAERHENGEIVGYVGTITDITERKQIEEALEERNEFIEAIMVNLPIGLVVLSVKDFKVQYLNPRSEEIVGWNRDKLANLSEFWEEAIPDSSFRHQLRNKVCADLESGDSKRMVWEFAITKESGKRADLLVFAIPMRERNQVVITVQDVTDRKKAVAELQERNEFIETVMDNLPVGLAVSTWEKGKVIYINQSFTETIGWSMKSIATTDDFFELCLPDRKLAKELLERMEAGWASGDLKKMVWEFPVIKPSGEIVDIVNFDIPMFEKDLMISVFLDVTERKRAEATLRERNEFIETIMDNLPIGLTVLTYDDRKVQYMNQKIEEIIGWPKEIIEDVEAFWEHAVHDSALRQQIRERVYGDWASGDPERMVWEFQITKNTGEVVDSLWVDIPMIEKNLMIATVQDITERKRAERLRMQLELAAKVQSSLLPHETPSVTGFEVAAYCLPAHHVGGDFYDWQELASGLVTLTLGDIMGKGIAAAMLMATVRATLRAVSHEDPPAVALQSAARALRHDLESSDSFVTLFHAHLNAAERKLTFVDCGHGFVFLRHFDGKVDELCPRGLPLGVPSSEKVQQGTIVFQEGDALVLYSDGLIDALPELALDNEALAERLEGAASAKEMVDRLVALAPTDKPLPDDLTVLVVHCTGEG